MYIVLLYVVYIFLFNHTESLDTKVNLASLEARPTVVYDDDQIHAYKDQFTIRFV